MFDVQRHLHLVMSLARTMVDFCVVAMSLCMRMFFFGGGRRVVFMKFGLYS